MLSDIINKSSFFFFHTYSRVILILQRFCQDIQSSISADVVLRFSFAGQDCRYAYCIVRCLTPFPV